MFWEGWLQNCRFLMWRLLRLTSCSTVALQNGHLSNARAKGEEPEHHIECVSLDMPYFHAKLIKVTITVYTNATVYTVTDLWCHQSCKMQNLGLHKVPAEKEEGMDTGLAGAWYVSLLSFLNAKTSKCLEKRMKTTSSLRSSLKCLLWSWCLWECICFSVVLDGLTICAGLGCPKVLQCCSRLVLECYNGEVVCGDK